MQEKLTLQNFHQLVSIDGDYFWFQGRLLWVQCLIKRFLSPSSNSTYADLGCGTGELAKTISENFHFEKTLLIDGHDFKAPSLTTHGRYQFIKQDLESCFRLNERFDLVTCLDVLEHLKNDEQFLLTVHNHLKPQGIFVITVPAFPFLFSAWDRLWGHYRRYSKNHLLALLKTNDFEVVSASYLWSYLFPIAVLRKLRKKEETEFPPVANPLNKFLVWASRIELLLSQVFPIPFGTSLIVVARPMKGK